MERGRLIVPGIEQKGERHRGVLHRPMNRIHQHSLAKAAPLVAPDDGQPSNPNCRQGGVPRQSLRFVRRKVDERNAGRR
jgi:hypothetical protein